MNFIPVKTPAFFKYFFPNLVWNISTSDRVLYLTFDDGPTPEITDWILDLLDQFKAKATFFCVGQNVERFPELYQKIISKGHAIGNHTYGHINGWKSSADDYVKNIDKASSLIESNLFRPPYGHITPKQSAKIIKKGYRIIMWNILSRDWDSRIIKEKCADNVIKNALGGDIIIFHDSLKAQPNLQYALPKVLDYFSEREYTFKRIPV